jgi:murein tripeptide amidase MpaA
MKKLVIVLFIVMLFTAIWAANETYFKFRINSKTELDKLTHVISIDNVKDNWVWAYANDNELAEFRTLGYSYEVLKHPGKLLPNVKMSSSVEKAKDWDSYPTYEAYVDMMYQFATDYPDLCEVYSIGSSVEGRELLVAKISDNVSQEENEVEFFYTGTMHGDETTGYVLLLRLINYLLENYGTDDQVDNLVNNMEIYINPAANPDGTYAGGNSSVYGATRSNANGIDLNRNFPDPEDGEHPDGNSWQPETVAMMDFADEHNFVMSANFHGGAEVVNYPWDTWPDLHADDDWYQMVSHAYADAAQGNSPSGYMDGFNDGITNGYQWYTTNGNRQDHMNYFHHCRETTIEISDTKLLPASQLPAHWDYNKDSFFIYMEAALQGIQGTVTNESGESLEATITILDHDFDNSYVVTDPDVGDYYRPITAGTYDLIYSAYGYIDQTIEDLSVPGDGIVEQNIVLEAAETINITGTITDADNGEPIENAMVELLGIPVEPVYSNANGEYTLEDILEGTYTFSVYAEGYTGITEDISITAENNTVDFELFVSTADSFEGGFSPVWTFDGNLDWQITDQEAYDGLQSAQSGSITDEQTSELVAEVELSNGGDLSFWYKVSSESGYDYLRFYVDGSMEEEWSGEIDWTEYTINVDAGMHTFTWSYEKDYSVSGGSDCGWVDYVSFPPMQTGIPGLLINPEFLEVEMEVGAVSSESVEFTNEADEDINYELSVSPQVDWLSIETISGQIEPAETVEAYFNFDTTGLEDGQYTTTIVVNDEFDNEMEIPVTLEAVCTSNDENLPEVVSLAQNYPNPFNPQTSIKYSLGKNETGTLAIYNLKGRLVKTYDLKQGNDEIVWEGQDSHGNAVSSGIYFYKLETDTDSYMKKMILMK